LADTKGQRIPATGINKKTWFKAQKQVDLKTMVLKRVVRSSRLEELKHCGDPNAVERKTHGSAETLTTKQQNGLLSVRINCVGLHGKMFTSMIVVIEAQSQTNAKEKLRSEPFILCPSRNEHDLNDAYDQMKVELSAAMCFLSQVTDSSTPTPVLTSQYHQEDLRANPPPTTQLIELALFSTTDDLFETVDNPWFDSLSDFRRSRFSN